MKLNIQFTEDTKAETYKNVIRDAVNNRYDINAEIPLWQTDIVGPKEMKGDGYLLPETEEEALERGVPFNPEFYILFSFNHCLGDGLSMLAFARTYFAKLNVNVLNKENLFLETVQVSNVPPPLLDNFISTSFFGIISRIYKLI